MLKTIFEEKLLAKLGDLLKFHILKWTVVKFKCFPLFQMFKSPFFFHSKIKRYLVFNLPKTTFNIFSDHNADYQFKYISHCLCVFYPEPFNFSAPTLHIIEWKGSCKEFLLLNFSLNLITFRKPHLEEAIELMALPKTAALITKYNPSSQSFPSTLI